MDLARLPFDSKYLRGASNNKLFFHHIHGKLSHKQLRRSFNLSQRIHIRFFKSANTQYKRNKRNGVSENVIYFFIQGPAPLFSTPHISIRARYMAVISLHLADSRKRTWTMTVYSGRYVPTSEAIVPL